MTDLFLDYLLTFNKYDEWVNINDPEDKIIHAWVILLRSLAYTKQMYDTDFKNKTYWNKCYKKVKSFITDWNYKTIPDEFKQFL